jgi:predicted MFS family arabinose efflux permease
MTPDKPPRPGRGVHGSLLLPKGAGAGWFAGAGLVNAIGTGFFYPFSLLFFHSVYGLPFAVAGAGLTAAMLAVLPAMTWVGRFTDHAGPRAVLIAASLLRAAAFVGFVTLPGLASFLAFNTVAAIGNRAEHAATPALATALAPEGQSGPWLALSRSVLNAGIGTGALLGGLVLGAGRHGFIILALANAASFLGAATLYLPLREVSPPRRDAGPQRGRPWRHRAFRYLVAVNTVLWLVALTVEIGMPTYLVARLAAPPFTASLLFAVNTVLITLFQLPVAGRLARHDPWRVTAAGAVLCTVLLGILAAAGHLGPDLRLGLLVAGMVVYSLGELMISQARLVLLTSISPSAQRGIFLAFNQVFIGAATALAPSLVSVFLDHRPPLLWWTLAAAALVTAAAASRRPGVLAGLDGLGDFPEGLGGALRDGVDLAHLAAAGPVEDGGDDGPQGGHGEGGPAVRDHGGQAPPGGDRGEQHHHVAGEAGAAEHAVGPARLDGLLLDLGLGQRELLAHQRRELLGGLADQLPDRRAGRALGPGRGLVLAGGHGCSSGAVGPAPGPADSGPATPGPETPLAG